MKCRSERMTHGRQNRHRKCHQSYPGDATMTLGDGTAVTTQVVGNQREASGDDTMTLDS